MYINVLNKLDSKWLISRKHERIGTSDRYQSTRYLKHFVYFTYQSFELAFGSKILAHLTIMTYWLLSSLLDIFDSSLIMLLISGSARRNLYH